MTTVAAEGLKGGLSSHRLPAPEGRVIFGVGAATLPARSRPSTRRSSTRTPTARCSRRASRSGSRAFEGKPFSHGGKYYAIPPKVPYRGYTLKEITLVPAPERLPVECWQPTQSGSERAFDFMAKYGIGGGSAEGGAVERHMGSAAGRIVRRHDSVRRRLSRQQRDRPNIPAGPNNGIAAKGDRLSGRWIRSAVALSAENY